MAMLTELAAAWPAPVDDRGQRIDYAAIYEASR